ncbi:DUF5134 domain-containing protein [Streptomyces kunmingensis]|uniref:DUF5134 domain-containing protein n=1 Tax=Streptomyces kunmingensis TaxID=68225 RepID=A0ABU6CK03_9ACTN|nr:DUF5134 domain-containing protein [Streptomyces kunmingensis]MEB3965049.1 DUF5134 domain-containing protein [Streptomyces kunmingensis]
MHGPLSAAWLLVALCAATGAYCLLRMRSRVEEQRRTAGDEALMGFGMALMALPAAVLTPPPWAWLLYATVFGAAALRALWAARRGARHLHHLVGTFAMAYMAVEMAARPAAHAEHGTAGTPALTGVLLGYFAVYVLWSGARLVPAATGAVGGPSLGGWGDRPELARACRLSMGIGTLAMLLTM